MPTATTMQNSISTSDCTSLLGQSRLSHAEKDVSIAIGSLPALNKALGGITIEPIDLATSLPSASTIDTFVSERSDTENGDNDVCASHARHGAPIWALQNHGDDTETNAPVSWIAPLPNMALDCKVHTHKQSRTTDQSIYKQPGVTTIVSRSCTALNAVKRPANILITERPATVYLTTPDTPSHRQRSLSVSHIDHTMPLMSSPLVSMKPKDIEDYFSANHDPSLLSESSDILTGSNCLPLDSAPSTISSNGSASTASMSSTATRYSCLLERALSRCEYPKTPGICTTVRLQRSAKKLADFFGDTPPMDVSVSEVARNGLAMMLKAKLPLCYFLRCLLDEFCSENLFFYMEIEQYQTFPFGTWRERRAAANDLYQMYLSTNSRIEVNLTERCRRSVADRIRRADNDEALHYCFDEAKAAVLRLLEDSFMRFRAGVYWTRMEQELGDTNLYAEPARDRAVAQLTRHAARRTLRPQRVPAKTQGQQQPDVAPHDGDPLLSKLIDEFLHSKLDNYSIVNLNTTNMNTTSGNNNSHSPNHVTRQMAGHIRSASAAPTPLPQNTHKPPPRSNSPSIKVSTRQQEGKKLQRSRSVSLGPNKTTKQQQQQQRNIIKPIATAPSPPAPRQHKNIDKQHTSSNLQQNDKKPVRIEDICQLTTFLHPSPERTRSNHRLFGAASMAIKRSVDNLRGRR